MSEIRPLEAEYATIKDGRTYEQYVEDDAQEFLADLEGDGYDPSHLIRNMLDAYGMSVEQAQAAHKRYKESLGGRAHEKFVECTVEEWLTNFMPLSASMGHPRINAMVHTMAKTFGMLIEQAEAAYDSWLKENEQ